MDGLTRAGVLREEAAALERAGRWEEAEALHARLLRSDPADLRACLRLADLAALRGRRARAEGWLGRAAKLDPRRRRLPLDWFGPFVKLGRHLEAFEVAERVLDAGLSIEALRVFWNPWGWALDGLRDPQVKKLDLLIRSRPRAPWAHFFRGSLRSGEESLSDFDALARYSPKRYRWMELKAGWAYLMLGRPREAEMRLRLALRSRPMDWKARGYLAEALLCQGKTREALREMDKARAEAGLAEAGEALAWRGALDLWLGRYGTALRELDGACRSGSLLALGWRGAAKLKLGRPREALADLDRALELYPLDHEAYIWRGETKRALGLPREALKDLERPPERLWAVVNRSLVRGDLGDYEGMRRDFEKVPAYVVSFIRRRRRGFGETGVPSAREMREVLEAALSLARGFRRDDYRQAVWMR